MAIITTGDIPALLRPGLEKVGLDYSRYKGEYAEVFTTYKSFLNYEQDVDLRATGYAQEVAQGAQIPIDSMAQSYTYQFVHRKFGLGFEITEEAMEDDQYERNFFNSSKNLVTSYEQTREVMAMNIFNQAFNSAVLIGDGQPLCSLTHPIAAGGTFSNMLPVRTDLSEAGLQQAIVLAQRFKDQAGMLIRGAAKAILISPELEFQACRLTESVYRVGTANNDPNAIFNMKAIPKGYTTNHYLTATGNWFLLTNIEGTLKHFERVPLKINFSTDPRTKTLSVLGSGRYSFGVFTPLGVIGSQGSVVQ